MNEATVLTPYAAALRYPSDAEWIEPEEIADAVRMAERVIGWAEGYLRS